MTTEDTAPSLDDLIDRVTDRETFLLFVRALVAHKCRDEEIREKLSSVAYPNSYRDVWQNNEISSYLDASLRWAQAKIRQGVFPNEPSWQDFAWFLYAGMFWE
jgi:hypothetical protein